MKKPGKIGVWRPRVLDENGEEFVEYIVAKKWTPYETLGALAAAIEQWAKDRETRGEPLPELDPERQASIEQHRKEEIAEKKRATHAQKRESKFAHLDPVQRLVEEQKRDYREAYYAAKKARFLALPIEEQARIKEEESRNRKEKRQKRNRK